ncbi:hypothetical protein [Paraburkholderia adhaesiva]|uniref:hypothetical protein n=1 Tax=Paraburkholderia adhaesiva TaxID=2883244 RepID=UPI001F2CBF84|nr:hypothetical protein [Paraburkholderia adhaesiva]
MTTSMDCKASGDESSGDRDAQDYLLIVGTRSDGPAESECIVRPVIRWPCMTTREVTHEGSDRMPDRDLASSVPSDEERRGSGT